MQGTAFTLTAEQVSVGAALPELRVAVSATTIVMGAAASRDWQPQHHDHRWALERAGTRDIFLNTPTQAGWIGRYITDWTGPFGRIGRLDFRMKRSICPGDLMALNGIVKSARTEENLAWVALDIVITVGDTLCTQCQAVVALPTSTGGSPWQRRGQAWRVPQLQQD